MQDHDILSDILAFCYSYGGCCWISLSRYGNGNWFISTTVNLTRRSDNGRINSSPVSRSPAIVRWSEGCPSQSLRIPVEDADGDVVKCRYAKYSESYFYTDSFPYGTLDEVISHFCVNCLYNLFLPPVWLFCRVNFLYPPNSQIKLNTEYLYKVKQMRIQK